MKKSILYFHQGWTDIFNCLPIINYYYNIYDIIYLIMRENSKELINFYIKDLKKVNIIFIEYEKLHLYASNNINIFDLLLKDFDIFKNIKKDDIDFLGIGDSDKYRNDKFKNNFSNRGGDFLNKFYNCYNININERIEKFNFNRNISLEKNSYNNFIKLYGLRYILYHKNIKSNVGKYIINNKDPTIKLINLDNLTNIFFDYIKIIENSIEIHLIDSSWGIFIYLLDAKYKLFSNIKIYVYCERYYNFMFNNPKLDNWIIK